MTIAANMDLDGVREAVKNFVCDTVNPILLNNQDVFSGCWRQCGAVGLLGTHIDVDYGGCGSSITAAVCAMETLGEYCIDYGFSFAVNISLFSHASTLANACNPAQKENYLKPLCQGERLCAYALTEDNAGSDAYALQTRARPVAEGYILNGSKTFISLGPIADFAIVFASTSPAHKQWGITAFLVDLNTEGVSREDVSKVGLKTIPMGRLEFSDCFVPLANVIGKPGSGAAVFEESQIWERSFILASQVGAMQRQLNITLEFAKERQQFGKPITQFQSVANRIADMRVRLETSRLMLRNVAQLKSEGKSTRLESALIKLHLSECYLENSLDAVRIHAAQGYTGKALASNDLLDSVAGLLIGGTNDIQRGIITRLLGV